MNTPHTGSQGATPEGPETFAFSPDSMDRAREIIACYPEARRRSAVMPLLDLAQRQIGGWLPLAAMDQLPGLLDMPAIRVYEVASFYTMYNLAPVGRHHVQVCTTTPCWLRGSDAILGACRKTLGIDVGETTEDGEFTLGEVECLGACVNAPVVKIGDDYFEDLDPAAVKRVLEALKKGESVTPGVQGDRVSSEPVTGLTTLTDLETKEPPAKSGPSQSSPSQSGES